MGQVSSVGRIGGGGRVGGAGRFQHISARALQLHLQTASAGSCALTWNGDATEPAPGSTFASDIATLQRHGGNVIINCFVPADAV